MSNVLDELRARKWRKPFAPFAIVVSDGRRLPVTKPLHCAFNEGIVIVVNDGAVSERCKPSQIVGFETLQPVG